jgi:ATP-binding cassette subfamily B protein
MANTEKKPGRAWPVIRDYTKAGRRYPWLFVLTIVGSLLIELSALGTPLAMKQFIDRISAGDTSDTVVHSLLLILAVYAGIAFVGWIGRRIQMLSLQYFEARVMVDLYHRAFAHLIGHSHDFFSRNFSGALQRRVSRYAQSFESVIDIFTFGFFSTAVFAIGVMAVLAQRNVWLGVGVFVWTVFFVWLQVVMTRWRQPLRVARAREETAVTGVLSDSISEACSPARSRSGTQLPSAPGTRTHGSSACRGYSPSSSR